MSEKNVILKKIVELTEINEEIKRNIKFLNIINNNVILVTNEDKVYCFGNNSCGVLGFGHQNPVNELTINEELNNKKIVDFKNSFYHTIARNSNGKLYFWGNKLCSNDERRDREIYKPKLNNHLINENIIDYCCGGWHTLALTSNKEVYAWGANHFGQLGNNCIGGNMSKPHKISGFKEERVKAISCGSYHSMALTESGCVYSWGDNQSGQLGINNGLFIENKPKHILIGVKIKKIICGPEHSLLLSYEGDIYVFGNNEFGQLGLLFINGVKQLTPIKLNLSEKFIEIASHYRYDISVALSENGLYFVWGECGTDGITNEPKETKFKSFNEIFVVFWKNTYETAIFNRHNTNTIIQSELSPTSNTNQWKIIA